MNRLKIWWYTRLYRFNLTIMEVVVRILIRATQIRSSKLILNKPIIQIDAKIVKFESIKSKLIDKHCFYSDILVNLLGKVLAENES